MKETKKRKLLISIGIIFILLAILFIKALPILSMKPVETGDVLDTGVYAVKNSRNNLFFIKADEGYIVIDAGSDIDTVESSLDEIEISPLEVKYVLLTHTDYDHVEALKIFSNAEIYMSEDELQMVDGSTKRNFFSKNTLPVDIDLKNITLIADGEKFNLGGVNIEGRKAAGHTLGSMAYLINEQYLFTGDAFMVSGNIMGVHPFTMNKQKALETIQKLYEVKDESQVIFTAHYGCYEADKLLAK